MKFFTWQKVVEGQVIEQSWLAFVKRLVKGDKYNFMLIFRSPFTYIGKAVHPATYTVFHNVKVRNVYWIQIRKNLAGKRFFTKQVYNELA